jgi:hypothetical protein
VHAASLRVEPGHDVVDDAVLAGGIHPLEHDEQRPAAVGIEALLQLGEALTSSASNAWASSLSRPPVLAGSNAARRKRSGSSMRNRLTSFDGVMMPPKAGFLG